MSKLFDDEKWKDVVKDSKYSPAEYRKYMSMVNQRIGRIESEMKALDKLKEASKFTYDDWLDERGGYKEGVSIITKDGVSKTIETQESIMSNREWNYYFEVGTEVMLDERILPREGGDTFIPIRLSPHIGKKGIVKGVKSDLHAFCCGTSYNMSVEFDGKLINNIWAAYVMKYKEDV